MPGQAQQQLQWATIRVDQQSPRYESIKFGEQWYGINAPLTKNMFQVGQTYQVGVQFSTRGKPYIVQSPQIPTPAAAPIGAPPVATAPGPIAPPAPPPPAAVPGVPGAVLVAKAPLPQVPVTPVAALPAPGGPPPIPPPVVPVPGNGNVSTIAPLADPKQASIEKQVRQKAIAEILTGFVQTTPNITSETLTKIGNSLNEMMKGF